MTKKTIFSTALIAVMCLFSVSMQAQFNLKKAGKALGKVAEGVAGDAVADKVAIKIINWMDQNNVLAPDNNEYSTRLQSLVKGISTGDVVANFKVYENPEANILACADGSIRVYSGMMDVLEDDELLAVIGVQVGHIANKDVRDSMLKAVSGGNASKAGAAQLEKVLSMSGDGLGTVVNEFIQVPYSEKQNKAADVYAVNFLKNNSKDPEALVSALIKFSEMEENDANEEAEELSAAAKFVKVNSGNSERASLLD